MKTPKVRARWGTEAFPAAAFTLIELLVVTGVIALLVMLHVSARAGVRRHTKVAMCANNVQMLTFALHRYGNENNGRLPVISGFNYGLWAWDLPTNVPDMLIRYDLQTNTFYCPGTSLRFTEQDNANLWNWQPSYRIIGYVLALRGANAVATSNLNWTLLPEHVQVGTNAPCIVPNSARVLVADATISAVGQNDPAQRYSTAYNYTYILGGFYKPHLSAHLEGRYPVGGNVGMVDGHVEWRKFDDMLPRTTGASSPVFWW